MKGLIRFLIAGSSLAALYCLFLAVSQPILTVHLRANALFIPLVAETHTVTLLPAFWQMLRDGHWPLAIFIFVFTFFLPAACNLVGLHFCLSRWIGSGRRRRLPTRFVFVARLSLLDIFVIGLLLILLAFEGMLSFHSHPALGYLIAAGVLTLINAHALASFRT